MKLLRFGEVGNEKPGILDNEGNIRSLERVIYDLSGDALTSSSLEKLKTVDPLKLPLVEGNPRIAACVGNVGKFLCIGLNYSDHAEESGMEVPAEPVLFMKATSAVCGPFDDVLIPPGSEKTDWEVELGIVIGDRAKHVSEENALNHVAGYCVINDLSERAYQLERCGQWVKGKSYDTFAPMGPWLVTQDEVPDPGNLSLWLEVDGHRYQNGTTQKMVFGVAKLVSYLSAFMTLNPGDVISTGTPPGVGLGQKPPTYLKPGQTMRLSVEGLGEQQQTTKADTI
jgi:2-keto-4-pentenoate hydratase/2-oxohepta-3-ene-1,7-dioic acid hydratase in catechol pathway